MEDYADYIRDAEMLTNRDAQATRRFWQQIMPCKVADQIFNGVNAIAEHVGSREGDDDPAVKSVKVLQQGADDDRDETEENSGDVHEKDFQF